MTLIKHRYSLIPPRGFTLVEMAIILGIMGLITAAIWWAASNARESQRQNAALNEMQSVVLNVEQVMTGQSFPATAAFPYNDTSAMLTSQMIPTTYADATTPTTADNPWSPQNFVVQARAAKTFRVSFYNVSLQGCAALLLKATACQSGQSGCPFEVYTDGALLGTPARSCQPTQTNCTGAVPGTGVGWTVMNVTTATAMCAANSYAGGINSVEFDYSL